jgi:hypothetical protein
VPRIVPQDLWALANQMIDKDRKAVSPSSLTPTTGRPSHR